MSNSAAVSHASNAVELAKSARRRAEDPDDAFRKIVNAFEEMKRAVDELALKQT